MAVVHHCLQRGYPELRGRCQLVGLVDGKAGVELGAEGAQVALADGLVQSGKAARGTRSDDAIIAFHLHSDDLEAGDTGLICSFGAGYSAGTVFVRKAA